MSVIRLLDSRSTVPALGAALLLAACSSDASSIDQEQSALRRWAMQCEPPPDAAAPPAAVDAGAREDAGPTPTPTPAPGQGACGAWPTAATVGIPAGTPALTTLTATHTSADGQVFDAVEIRDRLYVDHKNVVIKRSRLIGDTYYAVFMSDSASLTIEDSDVQGGLALTGNFTARRNHVHAGPSGYRDDGFVFAGSHVTLESNLIDGLRGHDGAHLDGIQVMAGDDIRIVNNWIEAVSPSISNGGVNAAIYFAPNFGPISNVTVDCNMLIERDGYYPLRVYSVSGDVLVRHNRWRPGFVGTSPYSFQQSQPTAWLDNAYEDGTTIAAP